MDITEESKHPVKLEDIQFSKFIVGSVARRVMALMTLGFILAVPCAKAQTVITMADTNFILAAAQGGMTEVKLGELAATGGMRDDVKEFGQMMVKDHTAINDDLKTLAAQKGIALPHRLDAEHQGMVDRMAALTGSRFDNAFLIVMIQVHEKDAKAFKAESAATQDADIKHFLDAATPIVQSHLQQATALKK